MKFTRNLILTSVFLLSPVLLAMDSDLFGECPTSHTSCEFYRCKAAQQPCGKNGYWENFGIPYCEVFVKDQHKFSPDSQIWLQDVRLCLQVRLQETATGLTCSKIKKAAMHDHVSCYVDTGFCNLTMREQFKIMWYLKGALRDLKTWQEAELLRRACQNTYLPQ
ncbi:hypothetical protein [Bdellovibrio sp. HCB288]|uniref:hypothetical protein n=1 Tax=Bdellovibrio sp. HCB288 TaxID=3394355 RepID=UPI0039B4B13F